MFRQQSRLQRENAIFGTREWVTTFRMPSNFNSIQEAINALEEGLQTVWNDVRAQLGNRSYVTMSLHSDHMIRDIDLGRYIPSNDDVMTQFINRIQAVLQSNEEIYGDQAMTLTLFTVDIPDVRGAGHSAPSDATWAKRRKSAHSIVCINNKDNLCGVYAVIVGFYHLHRGENKKRYDNVRKYQNTRRKHALALLQTCHLQEEDIDFVGNELLEQFAQYLSIQILVWNINKECLFFTSTFSWNQVHLVLHEGHYDTIVSITGFLGGNVRHFCRLCRKGLKCPINRHRCKYLCSQCHAPYHDTHSNPQTCVSCRYEFINNLCYRNHLEMELCASRKKCHTCNALIQDNQPHVCYHTKCPKCKQFMKWETHKCCHEPTKPKPHVSKLIFFDFEANISSSSTHVMNYGVAVFVDTSSQPATEQWKVFRNEGYCILEEFVNWIFQKQHNGAVIMAHNGRGYDYYPIFHYLMTQGITPKFIRRGTKLLSMDVAIRKCSVRFIDSLSFMQVALSQLPKMFGMDHIAKGDFPHLFNTPAHWRYEGSIPPIEYFMPNMLTQSKLDALQEWHASFEDPWNFQKEIQKYCRMDVEILKTCCLSFQSIFKKSTGVDPFSYITISSACMAVFTSNFLKQNTIAVLFKDRKVNTSRACTRFVDYIKVHHVHSEHLRFSHCQGEAKLEGVFVDGYCTACKMVWEFHGCYFHGCQRCYPQFREKRNRTQRKTDMLRSKGYVVVEMWECQWYAQVEAQRWCQQHPRWVWTRMEPRDGFFGGRTETFRLNARGTIRYVDFTSLYPWVNKYCDYPLGHPQKLSGCPALKNKVLRRGIFGMVYAMVLPPQSLWLPVLPFKANQRLVFALCRTCAETMHQGTCDHTETERIIAGVWCTPELYRALDEGYELVDVIEAHHFNKKQKGLFREYVDTFLKQKQEASGWPYSVMYQGEPKQDYIRRYHQKEGIELDELKIGHNPGLRTVNKLCLNSFWGRWGMKENYVQSATMHEPKKLWQLLEDVRFDVYHITPLTPGGVRVDYGWAPQFCNGSGQANIYIACFTTTWARLKLYDTMKRVGQRLLYCDTDSLIYESDETPDLELGEYLGDLTNELPADTHITHFVSAGPKNYGYELSNGKKVVKVKGFNLHKCIHKDKITLESMLRTIDHNEKTYLDIHQIYRNPQSIELETIKQTKIYRKVFTKRKEVASYATVPWGYQ